MVGQAVEQGIDRREGVKALLGQLFERRFQIARIGDQDVFAANVHRQHHVHRKREDVVQRQGTHTDDLFATGQQVLEHGAVPGLGLQHVGNHVAVQQHCALGYPGGAARVLQHGNIVWPNLGAGKGGAFAFVQCVFVGHGLGQCKRRHQLFDVAHHVIDQRALEPAQGVAHAAQHYMLNLRVGNALLQSAGKVFDDDDGLGPRILQLVLQLAGGVQRIDVHNHQPGPQHRRHGHRVLGHVGHHQRHTIALGQAQRLQIGGKRLAETIKLGKAHVLAHKVKRHPARMLGKSLLHQRHQGGVAAQINLGRDAFGVVGQPGALLHEKLSFRCLLGGLQKAILKPTIKTNDSSIFIQGR